MSGECDPVRGRETAAGERRIDEILESITDAFFAVDHDWRITYVNSRGEELTGSRRDEILGRPIWELYPQLVQTDLHDALQRAMQERIALDLDHPSPIRPGVWHRFHIAPISDGVAVYARDISARKRAEAALQESEARFRSLTEHSSDLVILLDRDATIRYASISSARVLGYSQEELLGGVALELVHPEDLQKTIAALQRFVEHPEVVHRAEFRARHSDGSWRILEARGTNRLTDPVISGLVVTCRDVTEQRVAEERLQQREEQLAEAQRLAGMGSWEWAIQENKVSWSDNLYRIFGLAPEEFLATFEGYLERVHPEDELDVRRAVELGVTTGFFDFEHRIVRPGGEVRQIYTRGQLVRDASGEPVRLIGTAQDVTERRAAEKVVLKAREEAEAANRAKSEFLSRMSHELRTPLTAILGFGQLLELELETAENRESAEQILKAGRHLLNLIDEVLDIARVEAERMSLSIEPVPLAELLPESSALVRHLASQEGIQLRTQEAIPSDLFVRADQQRLKQVLLNLLSNAIKYNHRGGTVTLSCERKGEDRLRIAVSDTGYGIAADKIDRLFTPFDRLGAEQTGVEGTGLGLALSKALVQAMGGSLLVESVEGEGSTFIVELELIPGPAAVDRLPPLPAEVQKPAAHSSHTVLFIEDNLSNVRLMERLFQRRPHVRLLTAMQGSLGLQMAREHRPDLIFLDLDLPDLPGDRVLLQLQQEPTLRDVPVVMISGNAIRSQVQRLLDLGARAYVTKPFDVQELLQLLDESLAAAEELRGPS